MDLIEVKAKSASEGGAAGVATKNGRAVQAEWLPYVRDLAFQTHVLRKAMSELQVRSLLVLVDPKASPR